MNHPNEVTPAETIFNVLQQNPDFSGQLRSLAQTYCCCGGRAATDLAKTLSMSSMESCPCRKLKLEHIDGVPPKIGDERSRPVRHTRVLAFLVQAIDNCFEFTVGTAGADSVLRQNAARSAGKNGSLSHDHKALLELSSGIACFANNCRRPSRADVPD
jgi:hypothetical protein